MKLEPHGVGHERPARQPRPFDRALAFLDPLLAPASNSRRPMVTVIRPSRARCVKERYHACVAPGAGGAAGRYAGHRIAARTTLRLAFKSCLLCPGSP